MVSGGNASATIWAMAVRKESRTQRSGSVPGTAGSCGRFARYEDVEAIVRRRVLVYSEYATVLEGGRKCTVRGERILRNEIVRYEATFANEIRTSQYDCSSAEIDRNF